MFKSFLYFILLSTAITYGQSEFNFENNKKKVVIPFKLINNLVFVPLTLNGEELTFLLDTGVEETVILSIDETQDLKLHNVETIKLRGLGSNEAVDGYKSSNNRVELNGFVDTKH
ncbi:MAG TPA: retropepsin-like aspartic protease, partial [Flavobacterium sp.]|nr:retropepsin-like aspartic protease [Flavobacterium sp.]